MKRVAVFSPTFLALSETFIGDHVRYLKRYEPQVLTNKIIPNGTSSDFKPPILLTRSRLESFYAALTGRVSPAAETVLRESSLIHSHFLTSTVFVFEAARKAKLPLVVTSHGYDATEYRWARITSRASGALAELKRGRILDYAGAIICPSGYIAGIISKELPRDRNKVVVVPNGVPDGFFLSEITETEPNCVFVGRLVEKKGCAFLLQAWKAISEKVPGAVLNIIGTGPLEQPLRESAAQFGDAVRFWGAQPRDVVMDQIRHARVVAAPSVRARNGDNEGLPIVSLEALASGKPLVCFRQGPMLETIQDGETGLFAREGDSDDLANQLLVFLKSSELSVEFGRRARAFASKQFSVSRQIERLEEIYDRVS